MTASIELNEASDSEQKRPKDGCVKRIVSEMKKECGERKIQRRTHRHVEKLEPKAKTNAIRTEINRQKYAQTERKPPE